MSSHAEQIERFKTTFRERLRAFVKGNADEIGKPKHWRIEKLLADAPYPRTNIEHKKSGEIMGFITVRFPNHLSHDEKKELRAFANEECANVGFEPLELRNTAPPGVVDEIRKGAAADPQAWQSYIETHYDNFVRCAAVTLSRYKSDVIVDPAEIVDDALAKVHDAVRKGNLKPKDNLYSIISRAIYREVEILPGYLRKQSRGGNRYGENFVKFRPSELGQAEDEVFDKLQEVLGEARLKMHGEPDQQKVLDMIVDHYWTQREADLVRATGREPEANTGSRVLLSAMAEKLDCSRQWANKLRRAVRVKVQETAHESGYEDIAGRIDGLMGAAERKREKRRELRTVRRYQGDTSQGRS